jgi:toxin ParE1/3/4
MSGRVVFRPEAEEELREAYHWYESRRTGLGADFLLCVEAAISSVRRNPEMYPVVHKGVRRALIRRFPYGVFYLTEHEQVVVLAVFHAHRDPRSYQGRG